MLSKTHSRVDLGGTKRLLEGLYRRYSRREFVPPDPLMFVYRFSRPADIEIAAFFASALAYGRVRHIEKSLSQLFVRFGPHPAEFAFLTGRRRLAALAGFRHRFNTGTDIAELSGLLAGMIAKHGSLERFFLSGHSSCDADILSGLDLFCAGLLDLYRERYGREPGRGVKFFLSRPADGGACKRLNLFLRWLVRKDAVDIGLWSGVSPAKLVVPVDVHMARLSGVLGFHCRGTADLKTAVEITSVFRKICPGDPVRYDFALTRIGILEGCTGRLRPSCSDCSVLSFCRAGGL